MKLSEIKFIVDGYKDNAPELLEDKFIIVMKNKLFIFDTDEDFEQISKPMKNDKSVTGLDVLKKLDKDTSLDEGTYYVAFGVEGCLEIECRSC